MKPDCNCGAPWDVPCVCAFEEQEQMCALAIARDERDAALAKLAVVRGYCEREGTYGVRGDVILNILDGGDDE